MWTIIKWVILLVVSGGWLYIGYTWNTNGGREALNYRKFLVAHVLPVIALLVLSQTIYIVQPGHAVVLKRLGRALPGNYGPGAHVKLPVLDETVDYRTTQLDYETGSNPAESQAIYKDVAATTTSRDGQVITLRYTVIFQLMPERLTQTLQEIGDEEAVVNRVVKNYSRSDSRNIARGFPVEAFYGAAKKETASKGSTETIDITNIQDAIAAELRPKFARNGVQLVDFLLRDPGFDPDLLTALEKKQIALEDQITSGRRIQVAANEASATVTTAQGQADAAAAVRVEITPLYIQYLFAKSFADGKNNLQYMGGDSASVLMGGPK